MTTDNVTPQRTRPRRYGGLPGWRDGRRRRATARIQANAGTGGPRGGGRAAAGVGPVGLSAASGAVAELHTPHAGAAVGTDIVASPPRLVALDCGARLG